ncbi:putative transferase, protein kinase RLK-Pelle-RLCK-VIIa-2 family [Helianthus annuus]|nr:putative transferase, protein kinase RLK-Pelle-RLCK-VIIa-2 family [Helianthus annuus]
MLFWFKPMLSNVEVMHFPPKIAEVNFLGYMAHPNIIKLLGYCMDEPERLLVYDYMPNKSLDRFLFTDTPNVAVPLSWRTRLLIMIGVARGLTYLHSANVIHRDVKSANILLDGDFNAKLADFVLARRGPETEGTHVSTRVMGTYGYAAPEYIATGNLTIKGDVYGFGVVLLESITGRKAIDHNRQPQNLVEWVTQIKSNKRKLRKIMDPRLEDKYPLKGTSECFELALRCVVHNPKERPSSEQVLQSLEQIHALYK